MGLAWLELNVLSEDKALPSSISCNEDIHGSQRCARKYMLDIRDRVENYNSNITHFYSTYMYLQLIE